MKANELRIGNWVISDNDDSVWVVDTIEQNGITATYMDVTKEGLRSLKCFLSWGELKPVILFPEILEKAGWERKDVAGMEYDYRAMFYQSEGIEFGWDNYSKEVDMFYDDASASLPIRHIKFLHELQNFIHSLTGQELKIKF